jgi:succinate dehydrogenase hydrophobic anchor subunit
MRLAWAQRLSAIVFMAAFIVHVHWVDGASPASHHVTLLLAMVVSGVVHAATGLFVVVTDYEARPRFVRALAPFLAAAAGGAIVAAGPRVAATDASGPTPGHLPGAPCAACHEGTEGRHGSVSLEEHAAASVGCETCHDVVDGRRPLLARSWPVETSPCVQCHEDAWGGFMPVAPGAAASAGPVASIGEGVRPLGLGAAQLCAAKATTAKEAESALSRVEPVTFDLRSSDRERFIDGKTRMRLGAVTYDGALALELAWDDPTDDPGDRVDLMTLAEVDVPHFARLGCVDTCHLGDATPHRMSPGEAASLFVVDVARARELRVTEAGIAELSSAAGRASGTLTREPTGWRAKLTVPLPPARDPSGGVTLGVSVFDGLPKAHALRPAPISVRLDCAAP